MFSSGDSYTGMFDFVSDLINLIYYETKFNKPEFGLSRLS